MDTTLPGLRQGELNGEVIAGGKSNLTYRVTDGTSTWALRRPPLAHVLPTAHDMVREYTVINALAGTRVPVAEAVALCKEASVLGAQFYLMGWVDGVVLDMPDLIATLTQEQARHSCELLIDTLVELHALDPESVGLSKFGRPEGFLGRQVKRWHQQWLASQTRPLEQLDRTVEALTAAMPHQLAPAIVHGDYRLTNVMFDRGLDRVAAVVDWEMATVGDPLADLGLLAVYHDLAAVGTAIMPLMTVQEGFLNSQQMFQRYAAASGRDLGNVDWYVGLGYFKLAVVAEGIHTRFLAGQTVGPGFDQFGPAVPLLLDSALVKLGA